MATEKKSKETSGLKKTKEGSAHKKKEYKVSARLQEGKKVLYGIVFNLLDSRYKDLFATCGGNRATVYRCLEDGSVSGLHTYVDENKEESFYTVAWMVGEKGVPLLAASGSTGVIRILDCFHEKVLHSFIGHGGSVNELRAHPLLPHLLISASKDESVRLWNVATGVCVLIFAGAGGHRNEVLSVDFHPADKTLIASCGMDSSVRVWSLKEFWHVVERSDRWTGLRSAFPTKMVQYPVYTSIGDVHINYIDHVRWLGDLILSKSVDNETVLWKPCNKMPDGSDAPAQVLQKYPVPDNDIWFIKFSLDLHCTTLAIGNREGKVFVWDVQASPPLLLAKLSTSQCRTPVRHTAVSHDARTILSCCEDGSIWRWEAVRAAPPPTATEAVPPVQ